MIDLNKPRHLVKDRLTGLKTYNGKEELTPCGLCYKNNNCNKNPSECWELDVYEKLKSYEDDYLGGNYGLVNRLNELENAIDSGELAVVVRCKDCVNYMCGEYICTYRNGCWDENDFCSAGILKKGVPNEQK